MRPEQSRYITSVLTLVGAIIGVGVFGVPYALSRVGFVPAILYFIVLGGVQMLQHLYLAEAAIAADRPLRMVGLVEKYVGQNARQVASLAIICSYWGSVLAYMLVGGTFLHVLFGGFVGGPGSEFAFQLVWSVLAAVLVLFGLDVVSRVGAVATVGLLIAMVWVLVLGVPHVQVENFLPLWSGHDLLLPYGIVLFSLSGLPAILEIEDILKGEHRRYRSAVVVGTCIAVALTAAFGFVVWGITGPDTTSASAVGLQQKIGGGIGIIAAAFGFLAVLTSFFSTAINLQNTFTYDYKLSKGGAWLLTFALPFGLLLYGAKNFVHIISFTGAVFGGVSAIMVALLYIAVTKKHAVHEKTLGVPISFAYGSIVLLAIGAAAEIFDATRSLLS